MRICIFRKVLGSSDVDLIDLISYWFGGKVVDWKFYIIWVMKDEGLNFNMIEVEGWDRIEINLVD